MQSQPQPLNNLCAKNSAQIHQFFDEDLIYEKNSSNSLSHDVDINKSVSNSGVYFHNISFLFTMCLSFNEIYYLYCICSQLTSRSLSELVHALLSDKKPEEVPQLS